MTTETEARRTAEVLNAGAKERTDSPGWRYRALRLFPVLLSGNQELPAAQLGVPLFVPWDLVAPHERQADRNHDQTIQRLAERGGLAPCELIAVLEDRKWRRMPLDEAAHRLKWFLDEANER